MRRSRSTTIQAKSPEIERFKCEPRIAHFNSKLTYPGIFLLQGWLGGILGGYILMVSICLLNESADLLFAVNWMPLFVIPLSILAVVKATILWAGYRLTGIQLGPLERVVATIFCVSLIAILIAFQLKLEEAYQLAALLGTLVLTSLPTALLVGSRFKPWELCTFGSMAVSGTGRKSRIESCFANGWNAAVATSKSRHTGCLDPHCCVSTRNSNYSSQDYASFIYAVRSIYCLVRM